MNKEVYKFIFRTYGHNVGQWFGLLAEIFRVSVMRVYVAIAIAQVTANVASGNFDAAKKYTAYFFVAYVVAAIVGTCGELISTHTESQQYAKLSAAFYQKLVGKDVTFYRDNQTGYLASMFRQHLDSAMLLNRFLRGDALSAFITLVVPPIVLFFASPQIGLIAALVVLTQFIYVMWSSSKINVHRHRSHEIYRKVTGEVSDVITNIIAFKSGGVADKARGQMVDLIKQEAASFEMRRKTATLC